MKPETYHTGSLQVGRTTAFQLEPWRCWRFCREFARNKPKWLQNLGIAGLDIPAGRQSSYTAVLALVEQVCFQISLNLTARLILDYSLRNIYYTWYLHIAIGGRWNGGCSRNSCENPSSTSLFHSNAWSICILPSSAHRICSGAQASQSWNDQSGRLRGNWQ